MDGEMLKAYSTHEIAKLLNVVDSTVRKWCLALEENGYTFLKDERQNNSRVFTNDDVIVLQYLQTLLSDKRMSLGNGSKLATVRFNRANNTLGTDVVPAQNDRSLDRSVYEVINKLQERIDQQEQFIKTMMERIEERSKYLAETATTKEYIDQRFLELERQQNQILEEILISRKETHKKKGLFTRLFGK